MRVPTFACLCGLLGFFSGSGAQELDPIDNMCVRFDHQSVVKNNTLFIDGGRQTFVNTTGTGQNTEQVGNITEGYNEWLIAIDLTTSWDWKTNISETALTKNPNPQTGTNPPVNSRGALYYGSDQDNSIWLYGGTTSYSNTSFEGFVDPLPSQYSLWSYNIGTQAWSQFDTSISIDNRPSSGSYAEAVDQNLAFFFNGQLDSGSQQSTEDFGSNVKVFIEGMIVIDTNNQTARNLSTKAVVGDFPRSRGRMQYVDNIGPNGILVQIGGNQKAVTNYTNTFIGDLVPLDTIDIFDVASVYNASTPDGTWYKQNATGDIPDGRLDFCLALASAPDNSSQNIYLYGGRGENNIYFDDLYVLSLPSFTWTKIYKGTSPRAGHTCHVVGSRTLLTVGGSENSNYDQWPCDWEKKGVGVYDLSALTWGSVYDAFAPSYTVPDLVSGTIGGGPQGNATLLAPHNGFKQEGLATLFRASFNPPPNSTSNSTSANSSSPESPNNSASKPHTISSPAAIVGGIIGGVAVLTLLSALAFYHRHYLHTVVTGGPQYPYQEIDGTQKVNAEMMSQSIIAELPVEMKPVELWSPDVPQKAVVKEGSVGLSPYPRDSGRSSSGLSPRPRGSEGASPRPRDSLQSGAERRWGGSSTSNFGGLGVPSVTKPPITLYGLPF